MRSNPGLTYTKVSVVPDGTSTAIASLMVSTAICARCGAICARTALPIVSTLPPLRPLPELAAQGRDADAEERRGPRPVPFAVTQHVEDVLALHRRQAEVASVQQARSGREDDGRVTALHCRADELGGG